MKKAVIYLGPPLSGKSTMAIASGIPRFSVRKWFEPKRRELALPPVGTMLNDEIVFAAAEAFLEENCEAEAIALDGFPATPAQLDWVAEQLGKAYRLEFKYVPVDFETARRRSESRMVCFACDGGADPVIADDHGCCPLCGAQTGRREDDTATRFFRRWDQYAKREQQLLQSSHAALLPRLMHSRKTETCPMDLHLHTTYSDGTQTPGDVIRTAVSNGLGLCAITDHDSCGGLEDAATAAAAYGIGLLPGIEINALWKGIEVHILGYGIDPSEESLREVCAHNLRAVQAYEEDVLRLAAAAGYITRQNMEEYESFSYDRKRGGWKLLNYLIDLGVCRDGFAYLELIDKLQPGPRKFVSAQTAATAIKKSGTCILAHPGIYRWPQGSLEENLHQLRLAGIQGIECYHSLHSEETSQALVNYCRHYGLLETGGSDDHGNLPDRTIGSPHISSGILHKQRGGLL